MNSTNKLATAALAGLLAVGTLAATPAFAGEEGKASCKSKSGCAGKAAVEKSECKGHASEKSGCEGKDAGEKSSCKGATEGEKASCKGESH